MDFEALLTAFPILSNLFMWVSLVLLAFIGAIPLLKAVAKKTKTKRDDAIVAKLDEYLSPLKPRLEDYQRKQTSSPQPTKADD